jgi:hypothetical protein
MCGSRSHAIAAARVGDADAEEDDRDEDEDQIEHVRLLRCSAVEPEGGGGGP